MVAWQGCSDFWGCLYDFQNLVAGVLALLAAILGGRYVVSSARLPVEEERKRSALAEEKLRYSGCSELAAEFRWVAELSKQAKGTIVATIGAQKDARAVVDRTVIPLPKLIADHNFTALLSTTVLEHIHAAWEAITLHNFNMRRAGGPYGDDNFQGSVIAGTEDVRKKAHSAANMLMAEAHRAAKTAGIAAEPRDQR